MENPPFLDQFPRVFSWVFPFCHIVLFGEYLLHRNIRKTMVGYVGELIFPVMDYDRSQIGLISGTAELFVGDKWGYELLFQAV